MKLLNWIKQDIDEVTKLFSEKDLEMYQLEKSKLSDEKYIDTALAACEEIVKKLNDWPYTKQSLRKTIQEIFIDA